METQPNCMTPRDFEIKCFELLVRKHPEPKFSVEFCKMVHTTERRFIPDIVIRQNNSKVYVADCKFYQPGKRKVDINTVNDLEDYRIRMNANHAFILASSGADITPRAILYAQKFPVTIIRVKEGDAHIDLGI